MNNTETTHPEPLGSATTIKPFDFKQLLDLLKKSDSFTTFQASRVPHGFDSISLEIYDMTPGSEVKTCYSVRQTHGVFFWELRKVSGFSAKENKFTRYLDTRFEPQGQSGEIATKRGLKELLEWVKARAVEFKGYPCPESFSWFKSDSPFISRF